MDKILVDSANYKDTPKHFTSEGVNEMFYSINFWEKWWR